MKALVRANWGGTAVSNPSSQQGGFFCTLFPGVSCLVRLRRDGHVPIPSGEDIENDKEARRQRRNEEKV